MTPSQRVTGVVVGLAMLAFGGIMLAFATGRLRFPSAIPAGCAGVSECEKTCAGGRGADCLKVGLAYLQGLGVPRSLDRAVPFLRSACDAGEASGCTALGGVLADRGAGSLPELRAILARACDGGDAMGCNNLANTYRAGPDRDPARALALYERACTGGSGMACSTLAKAYLDGDGVAKDPARANGLFSRSVALLRPQCDQGSARACGQVGWLHERGLGVEANLQKAVLDYQSGCDGNDGASCYNLAVVGRATGDDAAAKALFAKACTLGLAQACAP